MHDRSAERENMTLEEAGERVRELHDILEACDFEVESIVIPEEAAVKGLANVREVRGWFRRNRKNVCKTIFDQINTTPHEHQKSADNATEHAAICKELTELYARKNHDYGDSFHVTYQKWGLPMAAIRLSDKLQRFETLIKAESQVKDESIRDTLIDLCNYGIMTIMEMDRKEIEHGVHKNPQYFQA